MAIRIFESTKIVSYGSCEIVMNRLTCKSLLNYTFIDLQYSAAMALTTALVSDRA